MADTPPPSRLWRIRDLIDLEYFLADPESEADTTPGISEERELYLKAGAPKAGRPGLMMLWLEYQRQKAADAGMDPPGDFYRETRRLLTFFAAGLGLFIGASMAFSFLQYRGVEPVNVAFYLGAFVGTQILLLILLAIAFAMRRLSGNAVRHSLLLSLAARTWSAMMAKAQEKLADRAGGAHRQRLAAVSGLVRGKRQVYGSLFYLPLFILYQVFGICFNAGVLSATLLKIFGADIAFGWQSTLQVGADAVHRVAKAIALPWRWFLPPGIAHPSPEQIDGSHMILKDGIYHLATPDLISWWPFLCLAVVFYGLIPRCLLWTAAVLRQRSLLKRLGFATAACDRIIQRMTTPLVSSQGVRTPDSDEGRTTVQTQDIPALADAAPAAEVLALVPDDIFDDMAPEELSRQVRRIFGHETVRPVRLGAQPPSGLDPSLEKALQNHPGAPVLIVQEAWQPPIQELLSFLKTLRGRLGETTRVQIGLIGKPADDTLLTPVNPMDWEVWSRKIASLGDPFLRLERLVNDDN